MKITHITVSYTVTEEISETRTEQPMLSITVALDESDDPDVVEAALWTIVRASVYEQIDMAQHARDRTNDER